MICKSDISNLKTDILEKVGQKIIVKGSLGRSRTFEKEATIKIENNIDKMFSFFLTLTFFSIQPFH